jgi:hypothetical protein
MTVALQVIKDLFSTVISNVLKTLEMTDFSVGKLSMEEVQDFPGNLEMGLMTKECLEDARVAMDKEIVKRMDLLSILNAGLVITILDAVFADHQSLIVEV